MLPDLVLEIIAKYYRIETAQMRDYEMGWHRVHMEFQYLPWCPKLMRVLPLKSFYVPSFGNLLQPVTGYFWRKLVRMYVSRR